jgi:hypothetical protein
MQCVFGLSIAQRLSAQKNPPPLISLCSVIDNPDTYNGQIIRFHGFLDTDGFEYTTIFDRQCNKGVSPWTSAKSNRRKDVKAFNRALNAQHPGAPHDEISAIFMGRFEYDSQASPTRRRLFEILAVENLVISKEGSIKSVDPAAEPGRSSSLHESGHANPPIQR